jgi:hypothetical protein
MQLKFRVVCKKMPLLFAIFRIAPWIISLILCSRFTLLDANCNLYPLLGPELYSMQRIREGGSHQSGRIDAGYVCIERIKPCSWYLGADFLYGKGILKGSNAVGALIKLHLTDQIAEARLGYMLQQIAFCGPYYIPFCGYGYFCERSHFIFPSPNLVTFRDSFQFIVAGFLSGVNFSPLLSMGINFKMRFMLNGQSQVTDDALAEDITLIMKNEMQVRLDLPITYRPKPNLGIGFQIDPFYEFRHFGGRFGYPFNFKDTRLYLYGARFMVMYNF